MPPSPVRPAPRAHARRMIGVAALAVALVIGVAACSSDKKSSDSTTTTTAAPSPTTSGVKPVNTLTKADIVQMQEWLDAVGCDVGNNDGIIGPLTIASLKAFQKGAGLTVDGAYGPKTKAALSADAQAKKKVCTPPPTPAPPVGPTGAQAACTADMLAKGVDPAITADATVKIDGFGCASGWAYVWATVTPKADPTQSINVTEVMASRDGAWVGQNRATVCVAGKMPQVIYDNGCLSN